MAEKTDIIQELFDSARAGIRDDGFSEQVVSRLTLHNRVRNWVMIGAALFGLVLFLSILVNGALLPQSVLAVSQIDFLMPSVNQIIGSKQLHLLVIFLVSVCVVSSTAMSLIQRVDERGR